MRLTITTKLNEKNYPYPWYAAWSLVGDDGVETPVYFATGATEQESIESARYDGERAADLLRHKISANGYVFDV